MATYLVLNVLNTGGWLGHGMCEGVRGGGVGVRGVVQVRSRCF